MNSTAYSERFANSPQPHLGKLGSVYIEGSLIDVADANTPSEALLLLAQVMQHTHYFARNMSLSVNTGYLVLSPAQIRRVRKLVEEAGHRLEVLYTQVPQSQTAAQAQGIKVKEKAVLRSQAQAAITLPLPPEPVKSTAKRTMPSPPPAPVVLVEEEPPVLSVEMPAPAAIESAAPPLPSTDALTVDWIQGTLRSGRLVESKGHLLVLGDVNRGAELRAVGDIVVWGELKGIAHAGCEGNTQAHIRALKLDALQLRIADCMARRPDKTPAAGRSTSKEETLYQPELARIQGEDIVILPTRFS